MPRSPSKRTESIRDLNAQSKVKRQSAALCHRADGNGGVEVLLITSRDTGRWVIPKGGVMKDMTAAESAAVEAWEEAGVRGNVAMTALGTYSYMKTLRSGRARCCEVEVYALAVETLEADFREIGQRKLAWVSPEDAARLVNEEDLKIILLAVTGVLMREVVDTKERRVFN